MLLAHIQPLHGLMSNLGGYIKQTIAYANGARIRVKFYYLYVGQMTIWVHYLRVPSTLTLDSTYY